MKRIGKAGTASRVFRLQKNVADGIADIACHSGACRNFRGGGFSGAAVDEGTEPGGVVPVATACDERGDDPGKDVTGSGSGKGVYCSIPVSAEALASAVDPEGQSSPTEKLRRADKVYICATEE